MCRTLALFLSLLTTSPAFAQPQLTRDQKVRQDRERVESQGFWLYNDLGAAEREARRTGKPILAVLRCIPCEECVKLDDELVDENPKIRPLLERFVRVRLVSVNGLDLSRFQFDTDQSFAAFMMHADGTVYGRFGTRSHQTYWSDDVSVEGMAAALRGALELHEAYPDNRDSLAGKQGKPPLFPTPEKFPSLSGRYTSELNYRGDVVRSCIHCHQIGDAARDHYRGRDGSIPEEVLFPYPHPKSLGMVLDPTTRATVKAVEPGSPAEAAGFLAGDEVLSLQRQPLLSIADVQWVLHNLPAAPGAVPAVVKRGGTETALTLTLPDGWRRLDDIGWRVSTWGLRRMALGGMVLEPLSDDARAAAGIAEDGLALRVKHVGQFGAHAAAKNAGVRSGDILVSFGGLSGDLTETDLIVHALNERRVGEAVPVTVLRDGRRLDLRVPTQK